MSIDHYENFPVASLLLPRRLRGAVTDIYRFARAADDIADEGSATDDERLAQLAAYRTELHRIGAEPNHTPPPGLPPLADIFTPLARTIARHQLPITPFYDLLSAFEQDITVKRYEDYATLADYCTRSANPVGRLMLHLFDASSPQDVAESDAICTGLQLVNFWQDVRVDWHKQRVYLPQEDLRRHGVTEEDLAACRLTPQWRELMAFQVERTRALLHFGAPLARRLPGRIGLELRLVVQGGLRVLERIEASSYDVFMNRPELGAKDWAIMLWRSIK
ncbi:MULTISPECIES: squalene synthase HpnC [Achromobacter]|uniref:Phytoene synthase n=1 Tax=Achromobacter spanius TaxID=217203 RepID=A0AAW3I9E5_9BURK|nr:MULTISPECIES: squalene synthase HpnC [Achromobacter]KNE29221.1 phytoene synthase [Achromobacter spanius]MCD0499450.1 squalene synthase HpnC [Achromobacter sp. MY14]MCW3155000.1 squalene synthase HpnC [Achromobacter spanius]